MGEPTFEELREQGDRLEHWVNFLHQTSSDEVADAWEALQVAGDRCISANDYEAAKVVYDLLESRIREAKDSDWWAEMIEMAKHEQEREEERRAALPPSPPPSVTDRYQQLLNEHDLK